MRTIVDSRTATPCLGLPHAVQILLAVSAFRVSNEPLITFLTKDLLIQIRDALLAKAHRREIQCDRLDRVQLGLYLHLPSSVSTSWRFTFFPREM